MLLRMQNNWNSHTFLVGMQNSSGTLKNSLTVPYKVSYNVKHTLTI